MPVTYQINDDYCPKGHKWTFVGATTLFSDCYYCKECDKIYQPTVKEVTKEWFKKNFHTDRYNDIKYYASVLDAREKVKNEDLIKLGYLKEKNNSTQPHNQ